MVLLSFACVGWGQETLHQIEQVVKLPPSEAALRLPVEVEGVVTYAPPRDEVLFVQDGPTGIYVGGLSKTGLRQGERIRINGHTAASFRNIIQADSFQVIGEGKLPRAMPATMGALIHGELDSELVTVRGKVITATRDDERPIRRLRLSMSIPNGVVEVVIGRPGALTGAGLLDSEVEVTGVAGGIFNGNMQLAGVELHVDDGSGLKVLKGAGSDPWAAGEVSLKNAIDSYRHDTVSGRERVVGTLTYYEPGELAVIESDGATLPVTTRQTDALAIGSVVEVTGFPEVNGENVWLGYAQMRSLGKTGELAPRAAGFEEAIGGSDAFKLVSMEGTITAAVRDERVDLFILEDHGHLFAATQRHLAIETMGQSPPVSMPSVGSHVRVTGVCFADAGNHWHDRFWFTVRMRTAGDMELIRPAPFWTVRRMVYMVVGLLLATVLAVVWVWLLRREVREQTLEVARRSRSHAEKERRQAQLEVQRSRILEMINKPIPLADLLDAIATMVASRMDGAPCWFELTPELQMSYSEVRSAQGVVESVELIARDGTRLGRLCAIPPEGVTPDGELRAGMQRGARLAELAIDTRRMMRDLRHRSEHDLLTGAANRFSMERELERLLIVGNATRSHFGLIYVDLDFFKQVNDRYGHRSGDVYLTAVAERMKSQLRSNDMLARVGGDEFIVLIPELRDREGAEDVMKRIKGCFGAPFDVDGMLIVGSASVGLAVYPEDGESMETLQKAADAAMYASKAARRVPEVMGSLEERKRCL